MIFILYMLNLFQALSVLVDYLYYKRWTSSVLNLLLYNVLGGGESHLYGVEGPLFYLRNGFNNFNLCFVLALLFPMTLLAHIVRRKYVPELLVIISPVYIWLGFMSMQPHKEERFDDYTLSSCMTWPISVLFFYISFLHCVLLTSKSNLFQLFS